MNSNISDKDKKDWENFLSKNESLPNKDLKDYKKFQKKTILYDLHGYSLDDANKKIKDLPEPSFNTLLGSIKIMEFTGHSSFRIKHKFEKQEISLLFERKDIDWKITQIEFPDDLFKDFKDS